jgi:uncharacterized membrane protein YbhN (UPF0104 family)
VKAADAEPVRSAGRGAAVVRWAVRATGLAALAILFVRSADLVDRTAAALGATAWPGVIAAWCVYGVGLACSAWRLRVLVTAADRTVGFGSLFGDVLKSTAVNALLTVGSGEVYRITRLRAVGLGAVEAGALVLLDRIVGFAVIAGAGALGLFAFGGEWTGVRLPWPALAAAAGIAMLAAHAAGRAVVARFAPGALPFFSVTRVRLATLGCSLGVLLAWVVSVWMLARALGLAVGLPVVAFAAPLVALASMLPISIGGIGVREAGYALLLGPYGVSPGEAVALGLLQYGGYLVVAAIGGALLVLERRPLRPAASPGVADELGVDP